jgi:hypothetical protein
MEHSNRRYEYNRINDALRDINMVIEKSEASASNMRYQPETNFSKAQIHKIIEKNKERVNEMNILEKRLADLKAGLLDNELRVEVRAQMDEARDKKRLTMQRKKDLAADKEAKSILSKAYYQATRKQDRRNKYANKNMNRSYRHFTRACNSIPGYMLRNLSDMPNNKGYFWKSVACYGDLPREIGQPTVLFDRRRGGIMVIHEWSPDEYKVYEKKGKDRKVLVSCTKRRHRDLPPMCAEVEKREKEEAQKASRYRRRRSSRKSDGRKSKDKNNKRTYRNKPARDKTKTSRRENQTKTSRGRGR